MLLLITDHIGFLLVMATVRMLTSKQHVLMPTGCLLSEVDPYPSIHVFCHCRMRMPLVAATLVLVLNITTARIDYICAPHLKYVWKMTSSLALKEIACKQSKLNRR